MNETPKTIKPGCFSLAVYKILITNEDKRIPAQNFQPLRTAAMGGLAPIYYPARSRCRWLAGVRAAAASILIPSPCVLGTDILFLLYASLSDCYSGVAFSYRSIISLMHQEYHIILRYFSYIHIQSYLVHQLWRFPEVSFA